MIMYLAKIIMDPRHPSIRQALRDRNDMHRNLSQAYPDAFLYRLIENNKSAELLTLSKEQPIVSALESRGYSLQSVSDLSPLPEKYGNGSVLKFDLLSSPSKKVGNPDGKNSKRVSLKDPEQRLEWLRRQGDKCGFTIMEAHEASADQNIPVTRTSGSFRITAVHFTGVLQIMDHALFWQSWEKGIGPEKAYGMGLLLLSR